MLVGDDGWEEDISAASSSAQLGNASSSSLDTLVGDATDVVCSGDVTETEHEEIEEVNDKEKEEWREWTLIC
jgi:hypothetical protein